MTEFVIFDLETTGIGVNHRIVEIAGVIWNPTTDEIVADFETLVNPERNIPAEVTAIHRLRAEDVSAAPTFSEIAPWLERIFDGRIAVAHNASFDVPFINREFARVGSNFTIENFACTKVATGRSLASSCAELGIELTDAHSAAGDVRGTVQVARAVGAETLLSQRVQVPTRSANPPASPPRTLSRFQIGKSSVIPSDASETLANLASDFAGSLRYMTFLNETFKDLVITGEEFERLDRFAAEAGLSSEEVTELNRRFLGELETAALRDRIVTESEMALIAAFAEQVGLEPTVTVTGGEGRVSISAGSLICVTGQPVIDGRVLRKAEIFERIETAGFRSTDALGKKAGVGLLLVESYGSQSTKARNAVLWGIPILSVEDFFQFFL